MSGSEKKKKKRTGTQATKFFVSKKEVLCCSRSKQRQRNVQKSVLQAQSCVFAN